MVDLPTRLAERKSNEIFQNPQIYHVAAGFTNPLLLYSCLIFQYKLLLFFLIKLVPSHTENFIILGFLIFLFCLVENFLFAKQYSNII